MSRIERQLELNVPVDKAYSYLADMPRHGEWAAHKLEIQPASPGPLAVGSAFNCTGHQMGTHRGTVTITELVPNQKLVFESDDDTGRFRHGFILKQEGGRTVLVKSVEPLQMRGPLKLLAPIATAFMIPRALDGDLRRIRAKLEEGG